jgi:AcrR family transcriptional regulator
MAKTNPDLMRKAPIQGRAEKTIERILEASAQILQEGGEKFFTTNMVAERAGFSIGTLYQYFQSKEAILLMLFDRYRLSINQRLEESLALGFQSQSTPEEMVRAYIHIVLEAYTRGGDRLTRSLIRQAWQMDHEERILQAITSAMDQVSLYLLRMAERHPKQLMIPNPVNTFVISRALVGVIRSLSIEQSPLMDTDEIENELTRLVWGFIRQEKS